MTKDKNKKINSGIRNTKKSFTSSNDLEPNVKFEIAKSQNLPKKKK